MMYRYFTKNRTHSYIDALEDIVKSYNATPHKCLNKVAPKNVNKKNEDDIWAHMYIKPKQSKKNVTSYHFKIGDLVRLSHKNMLFDRSYDENFIREIEQRMRMQGIPMYKVKDFQNEPIKGNFYESELEDALWFIEKKLKKRKRNGEIQWLVKFEGWPNKYNQWISEKDVNDILESQK